MKYKLQAFFAGRNGFDQLGRVILWPSLALMLLSSFIGVDWLRTLVYYLAFIAVCYAYVRAFSRNLSKCQAQNQKYLNWKAQTRLRFQQRKAYKFYHCPKCRQILRVPRGKGKIKITCRSCGADFIKKT